MSLAPGARLGPYEIISALGAGGMGEVYRARDTRLDHIVAIKILPDTLASDPQFRALRYYSAKVAQRLVIQAQGAFGGLDQGSLNTCPSPRTDPLRATVPPL